MMDATQWSDLDKILRLLYQNRQGMSWYDVYTQCNLDRAYAQSLYEIAEAYEYIKIDHKGFNSKDPDPHFVKLTKEGIVFFSKTNFVEQNLKTYDSNQNITINNTISNSQGVNINSDNNKSINVNELPSLKKKWWTNPWLVTIGSAIFLAIFFYLIKSVLNIDL
ncbi:hypothetical protein [Sphingobacterium sp. 1.A.4]|uniref:hypothetical protein n=1 Tax=Sphingobacterium sp. 1.A.4 TaxID=2044603 RepID=UPI000C0C0B11|nr:hypothetical protein [Sphingobacterium sp. 1.A.4]